MIDKVKWVLEEDRFKEDLRSLEEAILEAGHSLVKAKYVPFSAGEHYDFQGISDDDCVITYSSLNFAKYIQKKKPWCPGSFCNLENFRCLNYMRSIAYDCYFLNSDHIILPLSEAIRLKTHVFEEFALNGEIFVRPDRGDKPFSGMVVSRENFNNTNFNLHYHNDPHILVLVSSPKNITEEWRFFVSKQGIISYGQYEKTSEKPPPDMIKFVEEALSLMQRTPDPIFVMDVCVDDDCFGIVELNSASCSGLYDADKSSFVKAMSEAAIAEHDKYENEILTN